MPVLSPDGKRIAFVSTRKSQARDIWVMNADGSGTQTNMTNNAALDLDPAFSPDGKKLVFASFRDSNWEIYVMNADGSGWDHRTFNGSFHEPDWGPRP
jgi:Tol biopolymer transport system component